MQNRKLEKDLIFYSPGKSGSVFTLMAGNFVDDQLIDQTVDHLEYEIEGNVQWVDDRRLTPRTA